MKIVRIKFTLSVFYLEDIVIIVKLCYNDMVSLIIMFVLLNAWHLIK